jgi:hypothetical protein
VGTKDPLFSGLLKFEELPQAPRPAVQIVSITENNRVMFARLLGFGWANPCFGIRTRNGPGKLDGN